MATRVSDIIRLAEVELKGLEWKRPELVDYLNAGFALFWQKAIEWQSPLVESVEMIAVPEGETAVDLQAAPLRILSVKRPDGTMLSPEIDGRLPHPMQPALRHEWYLIEGLQTLRVYPPVIAPVALTIRMVADAPYLQLDPTMDLDDTIPLPDGTRDMLANWVIMRAQNRAENRHQAEAGFWGLHESTLRFLLCTRTPILKTCRGYW